MINGFLQERIVQVVGAIGASALLSKSAALAAPALLFPIWGPWVRAGARNLEMYARNFKYAGLWRAQVLSIDVAPPAYGSSPYGGAYAGRWAAAAICVACRRCCCRCCLHACCRTACGDMAVRMPAGGRKMPFQGPLLFLLSCWHACCGRMRHSTLYAKQHMPHCWQRGQSVRARVALS